MPRSTVSLTVASSPIPAWTLAPDGAFGDANPAWLAYTGHGDDAARGDGWLAAIHEEDRAVFRARLDAAAATGVPRMPRPLYEASAAWERSDLARQAFGEDVHAHYLNMARVEQEAFDAAVTDWERARYLERG